MSVRTRLGRLEMQMSEQLAQQKRRGEGIRRAEEERQREHELYYDIMEGLLKTVPEPYAQMLQEELSKISEDEILEESELLKHVKVLTCSHQEYLRFGFACAYNGPLVIPAEVCAILVKSGPYEVNFNASNQGGWVCGECDYWLPRDWRGHLFGEKFPTCGYPLLTVCPVCGAGCESFMNYDKKGFIPLDTIGGNTAS